MRISLSIPKSFKPYLENALVRFQQIFPENNIKLNGLSVDIDFENDNDKDQIKKEFMSILYREKIYNETLEIRKQIYTFTK